MNQKTSSTSRSKLCDAVVMLNGGPCMPTSDVMEAWSLLVRTGMGRMLGEPYASAAHDLVESGVMDEKGIINQDRLNEINNKEGEDNGIQDEERTEELNS